jgi:DNA polymerase-3 subunit beta
MLTITASDTENTLTAQLALAHAEGEGEFCLNARRISDIAKELPDVDVEFDINPDNYMVKITFPGGSFDMMAMEGQQYPRTIEEEEEAAETLKTTVPASQVLNGVENTIFAVGTDELRPQMMGILWDMKEDGITFVSTDTRKLVRYIDRTSAPGITASFILPLKPAVILKTLLDKEENVEMTVSPRSAVFKSGNITLTSRFIKGNFPDYNRVIPQSNPYVVTVDRASILTAVRRVAVCTDPSHGLVKFRFTPDRVEMKVDDPNNSAFAHEDVPCDFTGDNMVIGFSASFLLEIFSTIETQNLIIRLADPSRPGRFEPEENEENTELVIILMPMAVRDF